MGCQPNQPSSRRRPRLLALSRNRLRVASFPTPPGGGCLLAGAKARPPYLLPAPKLHPGCLLLFESNTGRSRARLPVGSSIRGFGFFTLRRSGTDAPAPVPVLVSAHQLLCVPQGPQWRSSWASGHAWPYTARGEAVGPRAPREAAPGTARRGRPGDASGRTPHAEALRLRLQVGACCQSSRMLDYGPTSGLH